MEGDHAGEILGAYFCEGADENLGDGDEEGGEATGVVEGADGGVVMGVGGGVLGVDGGGALGVAVGEVAGLAGGGGEALGRVLISSFIPPT